MKNKITYEYTAIELRYKPNNELSLRDALNELGKNGWELISTKWLQCEMDKKQYIINCIFKRFVIKLDDPLESEDFFNLMQLYRYSPMSSQDNVITNFNNIKNWIKNNI